MKPEDVRNLYKTCYRFRAHTKMSANSFTNWNKWGFIPFKSQKKLEKLTNGALKAVWEDRDETRN